MSRGLPSPSVGLRSVGRQLLSQPAVMASVSLLVLVAAVALTALPRSLDLASRDDLHETLTGARTAQRNIAVSQEHVHRPAPGADPLAQIRNRGQRFADQEMSEHLRGLVQAQNLLLESPQFAVRQLPGAPERTGEPTYIDFRYQDDIADLAEIVEGRLPGRAEPVEVQFECPLPVEGEEEEECLPVEVPVLQVALTEATSAASRLFIGDRVLLGPDTRDRAWEGLSSAELEQIAVVLEITGVVELADPGLDRWFDDRKLHVAREVFLDLDNQWVEATGLMSPDAYGDLVEALGTGPPWWRYEWRFFIDPEGAARSDLAEFSGDLARLRLANTGAQAGSGVMVVSTRLPELIDLHLAQRTQTLRVMALTIAGIVATVSFAVLTLGVLMTERQRAQIVLTRDRGASAPQVVTTRLYQAILMTVPFIAAAYLATSAVFGDTTGAIARLIAVVLAVAAIVGLVIPILPLARLPLGSLRSEDKWRRQASPRRNVLEVALVFLAVACVILVRRRDPRATVMDFDWLLVATPVVVGAAVGALTIRLAGPVSSGLAWLSSRGRGAVSFLALRRAIQQSPASRTPLAVLVVCMAAASLSVITMRSIETGQEKGSWQTVGADFSITGPGPETPLSAGVSPEALGTEDIVFGVTSTVRAVLNSQRTSLTLWALETARHEEVFAGTPGELELSRLRSPVPTGSLPAIASAAWTNRLRPSVGQTVDFPMDGGNVTVEIVAISDSLPGVDPPFLVVDRQALEALLGEPTPPTQALVRGPRSLGPGISDVLPENEAVIVSRYAELDRLAEDPMVRWTVRGMTTGWLLAAAVGALSSVAALALGAARRRRDLGFLKTMGMENRGATAMTLIEQIPGVALATALGLLTGVGTLVAIRPSLDLSSLTGERSAQIVFEWGLLGLVLVIALGLLAAAGFIFVLVNRRQDLGRALRVGDE